MSHDADLALALARAAAHDLGNHLQPLTTALRCARQGTPAEAVAHLEMALDATAACAAVAERLRTASFAGAPRCTFTIDEALDEAREGLPAAARTALVLAPPAGRTIESDRGALVLAFTHLLLHALEATRERGPVDVAAGPEGGPLLRLRFGPPAPVRDEPPPPLLPGTNLAVRLTTGLAMAWVLATHALGAGTLRAAQGAGSGRLELWMTEA